MRTARHGRLGLFVFAWIFALICAACQSAWAVEGSSPRMRIVPGLEEPLVPTGPTSDGDDRALTRAIAAYANPGDAAADFAVRAKPLEAFASRHPSSAWRMAVLSDLALGYYRDGYTLRALSLLEDAWTAGRGVAPDAPARALVDRTLGDLARLHTNLGHAERAEALLREIDDRPVSGRATESVTAAREGVWLMRHDAGNANLCGPIALKSMLRSLHPQSYPPAFINAFKARDYGVSLQELSGLAERAKLPHKLVRRAAGQPVPIPSIVHWKSDHFAAIVGEDGGRLHLQDATVDGGNLWITREALEAESSGYFLVPEQAAEPYRLVALADASIIRGKGGTPNQVPQDTRPDDKKACGGNTSGGNSASMSNSPSMDTQPCKNSCCGAGGMATYAVHTMVVSLNLTDTPVGYTPPKGPDAHTTLTYNQREAFQPAVFTFSNVSPKWTTNWLAYVQDDPRSPGSNVMRYVASGGVNTYSGYSASTGAFTPEPRAAAVLVRTGAASYELRMPSGAVDTYAQPDGATVYPRRLFLTRRADPAGNALTLSYDAQLRLTTVKDATGRNTTFTYGAAATPLLITRITDPFGRSAQLAYDTAGRLVQITDVLGLTSAFTYDSAGLINALTTPYGRSTFAYAGDGNNRWLEATDPLGFTERFEFVHGILTIPFSEPRVPSAPGFNPFNSYINYRNTYHWDRYAFQVARGDYTKARIEHWLHDYATGYTSGTIESTKNPLENRVWYNYPGQPGNIYNGTLDSPYLATRLLGDGTSQYNQFTYNAYGKPLTTIDPVGRKTVFTYAPNNIDLLTVQQQTSTAGTLSTIASFTYNVQHLPLTYTDAAGQTTRYGYNAAGQLATMTNALNQTTTYQYDGFGRLSSIINANGATQSSHTYDTADRIATATDSEGYTLTYSYDAFDRVTQILYPDGTTTQNSYDRLDLASVKDRLGRITRYAHDANRRLTAVADPLGHTTAYGYYANGVISTLTDPKGNVTRWDIDIQSRPVGKRYANGTAETYTYETATSRLKSVKDALNQVKTFGYARDDRTASLTYTNTVNQTANIAFTYDAFFPRVATMVDGIGTTRFQYQPVGAAGALKLAVEDGPYSNDTIAYGYDALGRVASRTVDVAAESFAYDAIGRLTNHSSALGSFNMGYLGATNQRTSQMSSLGTVGTQWAYESNANDRRLRAITNSGAARSFGFSTTSENLITSTTESVGGVPQRSLGYAYDDADRLTGVTTTAGTPASYGYDAASNLTNVNGTAATYNAANQIQSFGGAAYTYDANGNLLNDGIRSYAWDAENRLVGIGYIGYPAKSTGVRYDGMGRRLAIVDTNFGIPTETRYLWCGSSLCQGRTTGDVVTRRYFDEGQVTPQSGAILYYGRDQLGSVRDVLAVQSGAKLGSSDYEAYGSPVTTTGRTTTDFRYARLFYHGASGLYFARYRAYDSNTARWISRDPKREAGGENLYLYTESNPILLIDPLGLRPPTAGENAMASSEFPNYNPTDIEITYDQSGNSAFTHDNHIDFPKSAATCQDFSMCGTAYQEWFVHEVTHTQQQCPILGHIFSLDAFNFGNYLPLDKYRQTPSPDHLDTEEEADWHKWHYACEHGLEPNCKK